MARVARLLLAITGNADDAQKELRETARQVQAFGRQKASATVDVEIAGAIVELDRAQARLERLGRQEATPEVQVRTARASAQVDRMAAKLAKLAATDVEIDVDVRRGALDRLQALGVGMDQTRVRGGLLSRAMARMGASAAGAGGGFGSAMKVGLGPFGAALNPMTAAVLALGGVIATSLVTSLLAVVASAGQATVALGALAIGGFGALLSAVPLLIGVVGQFKKMGEASEAVSKAQAGLTSAQETLNTAIASGSEARIKSAREGVRAAESELATARKQMEMFARLKSAVDGLKAAGESAIGGGVEKMMRGIIDAMKALTPMIAALRPAFTSLGQDMARAIRLAANDVAGLGDKVATMVTRSGPLFRNLARAVGPLLEVLLNIANAVLPHLTAMAGRLVDTFKGWAAATGDAKRMEGAIGRLVGHFRSWGRLLRDVGALIGAVFGAIAPLGQSIVDSLASAARETTKWVKSAEGTAKVQQVFGDLAELAGQVASGVGKMVVGFAELSAAAAPTIQALIGHLKAFGGAMIDAFGPVATKLQETFVKLVDAVRPALPFFQNIFLPLVSGVFQGVLTALQPLIWGLGKFAELLGWVGEKAEGARPFIEGVGKVLGFLFSGAILGAVGGILRGIGMGFGLIGRLAQGAGKILSWIGGLVKGLLSGPLRGLRAIGGKIGEGFSKLGGVAKTVWGGIKRFIGDAANGAKNIAIGAFNALRSRVTAVFNALKGIASSVWNGIKSVVGGAATRAKDLAVGAFNRLKDGAVRAFNAVKDGAARVFGVLRSFIYDKVAAAGRAVRSLATGFLNVGQALIQGLINGVKRMAGRVVDAVKGVVNGAKNAAKRLLGIGSPSKVFAGFGKDVGQGFANGITAMSSTVGKAIDRTMTGQIDAVGANLTAGLAGGLAVNAGALRAPGSGSGSSVRHGDTYNVTVQGVPGSAPDDSALLAALETKLRARGGLPSLA